MLFKSLVTTGSSLFTCRNLWQNTSRPPEKCVEHQCRPSILWRDAAISTPMLWSTLQLGHHTIWRARSYPLSLLVIRKQVAFWILYSVLSLITKHQWKPITLDGAEGAFLDNSSYQIYIECVKVVL